MASTPTDTVVSANIKLEIGPASNRKAPDGRPSSTWDTLDSAYDATYQSMWGHESLPIPSDRYEWVHASHVLEHIPWWLTKPALAELYRIVKPGGVATIWVPDAEMIVKKAIEDPEGFLAIEKYWGCGDQNPEQDPWKYMNARVFWGARPGELGEQQHFHRAMFGSQSLIRLLTGAGFENVQPITRDEKVDPGHGWMECGVKGSKSL